MSVFILKCQGCGKKLHQWNGKDAAILNENKEANLALINNLNVRCSKCNPDLITSLKGYLKLKE